MRWSPWLLIALASATLLQAAPKSVDALLKPILDKAELPALAAAVVRSNEIIAVGAVGVRKVGTSNQVTWNDQFHIGSCTKSMTAALMAMYVENGKLDWMQTIGASFPEWKDVNSNYLGVTIEQLLTHRGGVPGDLPKMPVWRHVWERSREKPMEQRVDLARELLRMDPEAAPGTKFIYANAGYTIAALILERLEKKPWEELIREKLFEPLQMESAGFGAPAKRGSIDQPWGHVIKEGKVVPIPPGPGDDNPAAIGPGGIVHCSVIDFARYANFQLQGARGHGKLLQAETFRKLHTPVGQYAMGWFIGQRKWAKGRVLSHNGTNTMNFAVMWLAPEIDFAVVVMTNLGGEKADKACDDAASTLIQAFAN